jgi:hypothetical protein
VLFLFLVSLPNDARHQFIKNKRRHKKNQMADGLAYRKTISHCYQLAVWKPPNQCLRKQEPDDNGRDEIITFIVQTYPDRFVWGGSYFYYFPREILI